MYITRQLEQTIRKASGEYPVVMVCGQRQVGKSTMLYHIREEERRYVSLDDAAARRLAENDPALFFETYPAPLLIDEFQRVPGLLLEIKRIVDERTLKGEDVHGAYWLTGSQRFVMMRDVAESLAGRVAIFTLAGLSMDEIDGNAGGGPFSPELDDLKERLKSRKKRTLPEVFEEIYLGGLPRLRTSAIERDRYYSDYIDTYLSRDIADLAQVGKIREFYDFLVLMAARTGQELKYEDLSSAIGVSAPTIRSWVAILERSGVILILRPYFTNLTKRMVKTPKVYFMDTGLAAYLCRWTSPEVLASGAMNGAFFETWVVTEIAKSCYHTGSQPDLYYYRDVDKREIDLLVIRDGKVWPIEIKMNKMPKDPDRHFPAVGKLGLEVQPGLVLCMADELIPYSRSCYLCPVRVL